jgi:mannose-6-phosphate isomerase-like protein (cupin superfamily)
MRKMGGNKMQSLQKKRFSKPDKTIIHAKSRYDTIKMGNLTVVRMTYRPGWQWSKDIKPVAKTDSCKKHHFCYCLQGRVHVKMQDGTELEFGPGDVVDVPPEHDAWVIGNKSAVFLDFVCPRTLK